MLKKNHQKEIELLKSSSSNYRITQRAGIIHLPRLDLKKFEKEN